MNELMINLRAEQKVPLYEQIYDYIKDDIKKGNISNSIHTNLSIQNTMKMIDNIRESSLIVNS